MPTSSGATCPVSVPRRAGPTAASSAGCWGNPTATISTWLSWPTGWASAPAREATHQSPGPWGRLGVFGLGHWQAEDTLVIRRRVRPLSLSQVGRLWPSVQVTHGRVLPAHRLVRHRAEAAN